MKLFNIIPFGLAVAVVAPLAACSDFLDEPTDTRIDPSTDEQLAQLLTTSYVQANYGWMMELYSDNVVDNNAPDENGLRYNLGAYDQGDNEMFAWERCNSNTGTDSPTMFWGIMLRIESPVPCGCLRNSSRSRLRGGALNETQTSIKGEALLIRAYGHFLLANIFCEAYRGPELSKTLLGIPIIKKPETTVKPHYERGTLAETYANIQGDIVEALGLDMANSKTGVPLVNNALFSVPKYHFNSSAGYAFAAKFFLFARNYKMALACADAAFGGPQADASQYLTDVYNKTENFYYLNDFGKYNQSISLQRNFLLVPTYSIALRRTASGLRYSCTREAAKQTMHGPGPTWAVSNYHYVLKNSSIGDFYLNPAYMSRQRNGKIEYGMYFPWNVSEFFEYSDKQAGIGYAHVTRSELTGDETLLIRRRGQAVPRRQGRLYRRSRHMGKEPAQQLLYRIAGRPLYRIQRGRDQEIL